MKISINFCSSNLFTNTVQTYNQTDLKILNAYTVRINNFRNLSHHTALHMKIIDNTKKKNEKNIAVLYHLRVKMFKTTWYKYTYVICRAQRKLIWSVQLQHQKRHTHKHKTPFQLYPDKKGVKKNLFQKNFTPYSLSIYAFLCFHLRKFKLFARCSRKFILEWGNRINVFHWIYLYISYHTKHYMDMDIMCVIIFFYV